MCTFSELKRNFMGFFFFLFSGYVILLLPTHFRVYFDSFYASADVPTDKTGPSQKSASFKSRAPARWHKHVHNASPDYFPNNNKCPLSLEHFAFREHFCFKVKYWRSRRYQLKSHSRPKGSMYCPVACRLSGQAPPSKTKQNPNKLYQSCLCLAATSCQNGCCDKGPLYKDEHEACRLSCAPHCSGAPESVLLFSPLMCVSAPE